jgi:membrane protein
MWNHPIKLLIYVLVEAFHLTKETVLAFIDDNAIRMAAALAFYTMFSIVPSFLMAMSIAGLIIGAGRAEAELISRLQILVNPESAEYIGALLKTLSAELRARHLSLVAVLGALAAGTTVFVEMHSSLNVIWAVPPSKRSSFLSVIRSRAISFVCVVGMGILLLIAVITNMVLSAVGSFFAKTFFYPADILRALYLVTQFGMVPVMLVLAYKLIPDQDIKWKEVLVGSAVTSVLFMVGKYFFGLYLASSLLQSVYGAAGSLFVLLVWVYYSAQVFYFGAELTKVWVMRYGSRTTLEEEEGLRRETS